MNTSTTFKIIAGLVLVAALAGIAFFAFSAGAAYGATQDLPIPALDPENLPHPYYGYGARPYAFHGLGCLGLLVPLFLLFLVFGAFRRLIWGPWRGNRHPGAWGRGWNEGVPPMFYEWHRRMHQADGENAPSAEEQKG